VCLFFGRLRRNVLGSARPVRPGFRDLRFGLLLAGETVNSVGGWASAIVLWGFATYRFNASPYAVSLTIMCWAAPATVLSPLMGVYVDRLGPKRALVTGYVAAAAAALGMAAAGSLVRLDVAAVAYGITRALASPAAAALPPASSLPMTSWPRTRCSAQPRRLARSPARWPQVPLWRYPASRPRSCWMRSVT
jgi:MFS family permease